MKFRFSLLRTLACILFLGWLTPLPVAFASSDAGAAGPEPYKFIVNLGDPMNGGKYLQVQMVFDGATPEINHDISAHKPQIQHALILLLSSAEASKLMTLQGKKDLMAEIIETVNHLLHEDEKTGVKDVYFTSFIIQ